MDAFNPKDRAEEVALYRSRIIGPLTVRELSRGDLTKEIEALSRQLFTSPRSHSPQRYATSTLERWYYKYKSEGLEGLKPKPRSDRGRAAAFGRAERVAGQHSPRISGGFGAPDRPHPRARWQARGRLAVGHNAASVFPGARARPGGRAQLAHKDAPSLAGRAARGAVARRCLSRSRPARCQRQPHGRAHSRHPRRCVALPHRHRSHAPGARFEHALARQRSGARGSR